eukprot:1313996-Pleurochrysis_carterae.AAC.1
MSVDRGGSASETPSPRRCVRTCEPMNWPVLALDSSHVLPYTQPTCDRSRRDRLLHFEGSAGKRDSMLLRPLSQ